MSVQVFNINFENTRIQKCDIKIGDNTFSAIYQDDEYKIETSNATPPSEHVTKINEAGSSGSTVIDPTVNNGSNEIKDTSNETTVSDTSSNDELIKAVKKALSKTKTIENKSDQILSDGSEAKQDPNVVTEIDKKENQDPTVVTKTDEKGNQEKIDEGENTGQANQENTAALAQDKEEKSAPANQENIIEEKINEGENTGEANQGNTAVVAEDNSGAANQGNTAVVAEAKSQEQVDTSLVSDVK